MCLLIKINRLLLIVLLYSSFGHVYAQSDNWNGRQCAVVLTYDDGYHEQLDYAVPVLDSLNLKATFYLSAFFPAVSDRMEEWKAVASSGHELGNHTLYHPCIGNIPGREWVSAEQDMSRYSVKRMVNEIRMTNIFLRALDGKQERTFAFTCGDMTIGDSTFIEPLKGELQAARAVRHQMKGIYDVNPYDIDCYVVNGHTADEMIAWVKEAAANNALLVMLFHGVGGGHDLNVEQEEHRKLLSYLKAHEKDIWVTPMLEVAKYIKNEQAGRINNESADFRK